ncbi:Sensor protein RstB [Serratia rubidaea]|uniref:Sensor protein RstB n=1 Tax=Serratia rubidaea TaxID=61652 RepID=A0A3S4GP42_SERRU|nr:Sensor protein RstB [Serratia rubidaea]
MRKLFVQFFLLLFVCFLVMAMLVGLVYKVTANAPAVSRWMT